MNQIIKNNNKKEISIPIFAIIFPLIVIGLFIVFSFKIYNNRNNNTIGNIKEQEDIIQKVSVIEETQIQNNYDISHEIENIEKQQEQQTNENTNTEEISYTADNGETYSIIGKLNIPSLNIEYDILSSSSTELLNISLNKYWGANPNEVGNMVIVGHNYKNNKFFSNLPKINIGDIVKITDNRGKTLDYSVYKTDVIDPYDNSCTSQLTDGKTEITLITCHYENGSNHATKRLVVKARAD